MEPGNILSNDVDIARPESGKLTLFSVLHAGQVICERIEPDVHNMLFLRN